VGPGGEAGDRTLYKARQVRVGAVCEPPASWGRAPIAGQTMDGRRYCAAPNFVTWRLGRSSFATASASSRHSYT
jgi:hypothetical protein